MAVLFCEAEDTTGQKHMGVHIERWKVCPTLPVLKESRYWKGMRDTGRWIVNNCLKTIVKYCTNVRKNRIKVVRNEYHYTYIQKLTKDIRNFM